MDEETLKKFVHEEVERHIADKKKLKGNIKYAEDMRGISHDYMRQSSIRIGELSDEFARLEVQIAALLFAFANLFLTLLRELPDALWMKLAYAFALGFLLLSLSFGLIHLKRKEQFWQTTMTQKALRVVEWDKAIRGEVTVEEAYAYHRGTSLDGGLVVSSPKWSWILQTITLALAVGLLFILGLIYLFTPVSEVVSVVAPLATTTPALK